MQIELNSMHYNTLLTSLERTIEKLDSILYDGQTYPDEEETLASELAEAKETLRYLESLK